MSFKSNRGIIYKLKHSTFIQSKISVTRFIIRNFFDHLGKLFVVIHNARNSLTEWASL